MIRQSELQHKIDAAVNTGKKVKVFFTANNRNAVAGKFIKAKDFNELVPKRMFRFVIDDRIQQFEQTGNVWISKIFILDAIFDVVPYEN